MARIEQLDGDAAFTQVIDLIDDSIETNVQFKPNAEKRRCYYDGDQWTLEQRAILEKRKESCLTDNLIKDKVDTFIGIEQKLRTDPKGYPRNPGDEDAAEAATKALRYVSDVNLLDEVFTDGFKNLLIEGTEVYEVYVDTSRSQQNPDIKIKDVLWDRTILDPRSRRSDYGDGRFVGQMIWMDVSEAKEKYGDKAAEQIQMLNDVDWEGSYEDRPEFWYSERRSRVLVFQLYYKKSNTIYYCEGHRGGFLTEPEVSPYENEHGEPLWPYIVQSSQVSQEGERIGETERYMDPQDNVNKRLSKLLHLLNKNQAIYESGVLENPNITRQELNKPDGMIELLPGHGDKAFQINNNMDLSQGQYNVLMLAHSRFEQIGPNAALQGQQTGSGRSLQIQQEAGSTKLGPAFGAHDRAKKRVYKAIWHRIKQFWSAEKWIRVTDEDDNLEFIGLNTPAVQKDQFGEPVMTAMGTKMPVVGPDGRQVIENEVAKLGLDIIVDDAPDVINLQSEQFANLVSLAQAGVQFPPDVYIEASALNNKERYIEKMKGGGDSPEEKQAAQQQAQMQQQLQDMAFQLQGLELKLKEAEVRDKNAQADERMAKIQSISVESEQTQLETQLARALI